jgi:hypothetical protein
METDIVIARKRLADVLLANPAALHATTAVTVYPYTVVLPASLDFRFR